MADIPFLNRLGNFAALPVARQLALLIGMAASVAFGVGVIQWATTSDFEPLYGAMSPADSQSAITALDAAGIPHKLESGTGILTVPTEMVPQARMALASEGFPRGGGVGFESLYQQQEMGLSSFMEQARYHRAVEAELARTIAGMDTVKGARVHLAVAKQSAFLRRGQEPSASVMVSLYPGRSLSERQLSGIVHLVASSIPNLDAARVSVVDQGGRLLSDQGERDDFGYTAEQFRLTQQIESNLNDRIMAILEPILGPNAVRAQVAADMDFTRVETTSEQFDPDTVVRSEQTTEDIANRLGSEEGGVPGALTDQAPNLGQQADAQTQEDLGPARETRKATRNFEVNKSISHIREVPGSVRKLSVAVVVDYVTNAEGTKVALEQNRIDEINALVREAVGFDQARGDTVSVINSPFVDQIPMEEIPEPSLFEQDWFWQALRAGMALLGLLSLVFFVIRPLIAYSTNYEPPQPPKPEEGGAGGDTPRLAGPVDDDDDVADDSVSLSPAMAQAALPGATGGASYHQTVAAARNVANEQPARAAYVVRNWMTAEDG